MKLEEIDQEALGLSESERAESMLSLMRTLAAPQSDVTDGEVLRRDAGSVEPTLQSFPPGAS